MPRPANAPPVKQFKKRMPITPKQRAFVNAYIANGRNGAAAYRTAYNSRADVKGCSREAAELLDNPRVAAIIASHDRMLALAEQRELESLEVTEERVIQTMAAIAFYDPREVLSWDTEGKVTFKDSESLALRSVLPIREIAVLPNGGFRVRFHDRRAAIMDLARLRGMISDPSKTFHFHEDLSRMTPEEQRERVTELLSFAASLKVPKTIDVEANPDEEE
jgi:phage terminase small subunit